MTLAINGTNTVNPFSSLQTLWQSLATGSGQSPSDLLSSLFTDLGQQGVNGNTSSGTPSSATSPASGSGAPQFGPQTLQSLLALQNGGFGSQSLWSQLADAANGANPLAALQSDPSQSGHRHHHHLGAENTPAGNNTDQTAQSSGATAGGSDATGNALFGQWMQMLAQLAPPIAAQSAVMA
jgi:hypothetical protein